MKLKLVDSLGNETGIIFPESLSDVLLSNKIAFDVINEDIALYLKDRIDQNLHVDVVYLQMLSRAVSEFLDVDITKLLNMDVGELLGDDLSVLNDVVIKSITDLPKWSEIDLNSVDVTLNSLYNNILALIDTYEFTYKTEEDYLFEYKERKWKVPYVIKTLVTGTKVFSKINTSQLVEVLQIKKYLYTEFKQREDKDSNHLMNVRFTSYLEIFAILCIEKNEEFPLDEADLSESIQEKLRIFEDIDVKTAQDVIFFLITFIAS